MTDRVRDAIRSSLRRQKAWLVALACQKPKELGYPHELWTTRLLAAHARDQGPASGHSSLAKLAQGTVCKILAEHAVKPHKVRYYLEKRDPEFEPKTDGADTLASAKPHESSPTWRHRSAEDSERISGGNGKTAATASRNRYSVACRSSTRRSLPARRPVSGACPDIRPSEALRNPYFDGLGLPRLYVP